MANEAHLLLTATGSYTDAQISSESWQVGVRLALVFGAVDDIGTLPNNWVPSAKTINRTESLWTITGNWDVSISGAFFEPDDFLNDQAAPAFTTWMAQGSISSLCQLQTLKLSPIVAPLGHEYPAPPYLKGSPCRLDWTSSKPTGGGTSSVEPLQDTIVASHSTDQIGRRGRGRMYVPGLSADSLQAVGLLKSSNATNMLAAQIALLQALTYSPIGTGSPHTHAIVTGKPFVNYAKIATVKIGNVVDTQRRRRRSLHETLVSGSVAP